MLGVATPGDNTNYTPYIFAVPAIRNMFSDRAR